MERQVLTVPSLASEHSLHAVQHAVGAVAGAQVAESDLAAKQLIIEFDGAATSLDQIKAALEHAGHPVVAAWAAPTHHHGHAEDDGHGHATESEAVRFEDLVFSVRLLRDGVTAAVGYVCPCGCKPQARYQKDSLEAGHEHCCCGRAHFAGSDAIRQLEDYLAQRRADGLDGDRVYTLSERQMEAPWGGTLSLAFADPTS